MLSTYWCCTLFQHHRKQTFITALQGNNTGNNSGNVAQDPWRGTVCIGLVWTHSCMHGHHIYKDIWTSSIGKELQCQRKVGNTHDIYAVLVVKTIHRCNTIVGHLPRQISTICHLFLRKGGIITSTIFGRR